jgi:hypothetical protein
MSTKDKVSKSVWGMLEFSKETLKKNLLASRSSLNIEENSLNSIFKLIDTSLSEGYNKSHDSTVNSIVSLLEENKKK